MFLKRILNQPNLTLLGVGAGVGALLALFIVLQYHASGNPAFCASCHSMENVHNQWKISNHKQFACVECHLPDENIFAKVAYKTRAGLNDLFHETLRDYPDKMSLSGRGQMIVRGNCLRCHHSTVENTPMGSQGGDCIKCHRFLVHGQGSSKGGIKVE
jgi:cytochrome c nitrite reductase small subunit